MFQEGRRYSFRITYGRFIITNLRSLGPFFKKYVTCEVAITVLF